MKSCKSDSKECNEIKYPCLMKGKISGVIVLMTSKKCGTVVHGTSDRGSTIGDYCENWGTMLPFNGSITLEND